MNQETKKQLYRGVLCRCCRQPIPLPAIVESSKADSELGLSHERRRVVFTLRCRACDKEMPYRISEVFDFEGVPRVRASRLLRRRSELSRAANA